MRAAALLGVGVLLLGVGGAGAGTVPEEAVRAFLRAYAAKDAPTRRKAVGMLESIPGPGATAALLPALADPSSTVRERAREVLYGRTGDADLEMLARTGLRSAGAEVRRRSAEALGSLGERSRPHGAALAASLRDRDPLVREAAASALGATGDRGQAPAVAAVLPREAVPEVRGALLLALGALDGASAAKEALRAASREREGPPALAALRVLPGADPGSAAGAAADLLRHPAWEVRLEAAALLSTRGRSGADVEALLAALRAEKRRRVRDGIAAALERMAGVPLGSDPDRWKAWWEKHREGWTPSAAPAPEAPATAGEGESVARFYDIPVDGDRLAFALDTSKSMESPARLGEAATKMQLLVAQFAKTLADLHEDSDFNVVAFGTEVEAWRQRAVAANPSTKYEALRFLQKRPPEGRTNIFDALALAMSDRDVDTVFLLTDGAPSAGEETTRTGFLRGLAWLRRWRPVRVHCVEVGAENTGARWKGFLADVATATGGVHVSK
jgi:HEAT repeat protein